LGDAHSDSNTRRQISLLGIESIKKMQRLGVKVGPGDLAENLTTEGIDLSKMKIGQRLRVGKDVVLEVTQIGKECETPCAIYKTFGNCVMPREGVFTRAVTSGEIEVGDKITKEEKNGDSKRDRKGPE
jgi:MOSC domain-containing protein YiiM